MLLVFGLGTAVIPTMGPSAVAQKHHVGRVVFKDSKRLEAFIASSEKAVLVDVYADWCTACKSMEKHVYAHKDFQVALEGKQFVVLDITHNSKDNQVWLTSNNIVGPPALLYFGKTLNKPNRLIGEKSLVETMSWLALVEGRLQPRAPTLRTR
jgi:thiol:disulfide interchange protein